MSTLKRNPLIRVHPVTRKKLKIIAAHYEESMQDTVERLATQELERIQKGGHPAQDVQIPPLSEKRD
jgi:hypothetical protein